MEKKKFQTTINAPKEKVWNALWNPDKYREWTAIFSEGSTVKTDNWKEGSKVLFLDAKGSGMVSKVAANHPNEFMSFEHQGVVQDGKEFTDEEHTKGWAGALENYTLKGQNGKTELTVEMDITDEYKDYFEKTWPQALDKIKQLAEE